VTRFLNQVNPRNRTQVNTLVHGNTLPPSPSLREVLTALCGTSLRKPNWQFWDRVFTLPAGSKAPHALWELQVRYGGNIAGETLFAPQHVKWLPP
jgi:hypothetical protein